MTLRLNGTTGFTEVTAPAAAGNNTLTLPTSNGSAGQVLKNSSTAGELEFANGGKILKVVPAIKTDVSSTTSTSFTTIPGFSASIEPSSASSNVLIIASLNLAGADVITTKLQRGSTDILLGDAETDKVQATTFTWPGSTGNGSGRYGVLNYAVNFLDSPNTTSETTYSFVFKTRTSSNAVYINRTNQDDTSTYNGRVASTMYLLEVAP